MVVLALALMVVLLLFAVLRRQHVEPKDNHLQPNRHGSSNGNATTRPRTDVSAAANTASGLRRYNTAPARLFATGSPTTSSSSASMPEVMVGGHEKAADTEQGIPFSTSRSDCGSRNGDTGKNRAGDDDE